MPVDFRDVVRAVQPVSGPVARGGDGRRNRRGVLHGPGPGASMRFVRSLPASTLEAISQALTDGRLRPPYTAFTVAEWVPQDQRDSLAAELTSLQGHGFTTATLAATLDVLAD